MPDNLARKTACLALLLLASTAIHSLAEPGKKLWEFETGGEVWSTPAVVGGKVYVGSMDQNVYCLDAATGKKVWAVKAKGTILGSPAVVKDRVYVGATGGTILCLDVAKGRVVWEVATGGEDGSSPAVADGKVYVENAPDKFLCLDAATGKQIWERGIPDKVHGSPPTVSGGKVYLAKGDKTVVYGLNAATGEIVWQHEAGGECASPAIADGRVFVDGDIGENGMIFSKALICLNAETGEKKWEFDTKSNVQSSPAVADGKVYVWDMSGILHCIDAAAGTEVWNFSAPADKAMISRALFTGIAVTDGKVFAGAQDSRVYCLDAATGKALWSYQAKGALKGSPAVADGKLYVGSVDGKVTCLDAGGAGKDEPWPMFGGGPEHGGYLRRKK